MRNAWVLGGTFLHDSGPWEAYRPPVPPKARCPWKPKLLVRDEMAARRGRRPDGTTPTMDEATRAKVEVARSKELESQKQQRAADRALLEAAEAERKAALSQRVALLQLRSARRAARNRRLEQWRHERWGHASPRSPRSPRCHRPAPPPPRLPHSASHRPAPSRPGSACSGIAPHLPTSTGADTGGLTLRSGSHTAASSHASGAGSEALPWASDVSLSVGNAADVGARRTGLADDGGAAAESDYDLLSADLAALATAHLAVLARSALGLAAPLLTSEMGVASVSDSAARPQSTEALPTAAADAVHAGGALAHSPAKEVLGERLVTNAAARA